MIVQAIHLVLLGGIFGAAGCSGSSSGSRNEAVSCGGVPQCGGTVDGKWQLDSVCLEGDLATALDANLSLPPACSHTIETASISASGTVTFATGTETDDLTGTMTANAVYTAACESAIAGGLDQPRSCGVTLPEHSR